MAPDALILETGLEERVQQVEAGLVGGEPGALGLHAPKGAHRNMAIRFPIPRATPVLQLHHLGGGFADKGFDRILITQPVAPGNRVVRVLIQAVARLDHGRRAAFGRNGVAAHRINLGDHGDGKAGKRFGHGDGGAQPRPAAADHQHVAGEDVHRSLRRSAAGVGQEVDRVSESAGDPMTPPPRQSERIIKELLILKPEITHFRRSVLCAGAPARAFAWLHLTQRTTTWQTKPIESNVTVWAKCVYRPTPSTVPKRSELSRISRLAVCGSLARFCERWA